MAYMNTMLSMLKISGCQLTCGQKPSRAPSAPRAIFSAMILSAVIASAMVVF
jgi:hypothetical protein